jgi:hypothetical protein
MFPCRPNTPVGVNEPLVTDRQPIWRVFGGDDIVLRARVQLSPTNEPVTPDNSILSFVLANQRFAPTECAIWTGKWHNGISEVDHINHPGLVEIRVPREVSAALRRGGYLYGLTVTNKLGENRSTVLEGSILIEYAATSPTHDIPYKDPTIACEET